jgi:hypothetical protein
VSLLDREGPPQAKRIMGFLSGSMWANPVDAMRSCGVDLRSRNMWKDSLKAVDRMVDGL